MPAHVHRVFQPRRTLQIAQQNRAVRRGETGNLGEQAAGLLQVMQYGVANNQIEAAVGKRQIASIGNGEFHAGG
jgi:hypothetical protein